MQFCVLSCRSLLYSIFLFHIFLVGLGHSSCMHSRACIPAVIWHTLTTNGQHAADTVHPIQVLPPGSLTYKQRTFHCANFATEEQHRQQCCSPSDHTTHCAALYTVRCSYDRSRQSGWRSIFAKAIFMSISNTDMYNCTRHVSEFRCNKPTVELTADVFSTSLFQPVFFVYKKLQHFIRANFEKTRNRNWEVQGVRPLRICKKNALRLRKIQ